MSVGSQIRSTLSLRRIRITSLGLQQKGRIWTVDVGRSWRAIAIRKDNTFHWFWIGSHEAYNKILRRFR
jgi:hypothetical protein